MKTITHALKIAVVLGLLGPLPGYLHYIITRGGSLVSQPSDVGGFWGPFFFWYATAAVPLFGSYCFIVGLVGTVLHDKLSAPGISRSVRAAAVVALGGAASVPVILLGGSATSGWGLEGLISVGFWVAVYLLQSCRKL